MSRFSFFRQSFWMLAATLSTGVFMTLVQTVAGRMLGKGNPQEASFALFNTLLEGLGVLSIPAIGLQGAFTQMAVRASETGRHGELAGATRSLLKVLVGFWILLLMGTFLFQPTLLTKYQIHEPLALWLTLATVLIGLMSPIFAGITQGQQHFGLLGGSSILNGATRLGGLLILIHFFGPKTSAAMAAVMAGSAVGLLMLMFGSRRFWMAEPEPFDFKPMLRTLVPLTLGLGVPTWVVIQDQLVANQFFTDGRDGYSAARVVGKTIILLTAPLATVLFPRVAQSILRSQKTNVLTQALAATLAVSTTAAIACTLFPTLPLRVLWGEQFLAFSHLVPWFAWALLPFALFTVLLQSLIARQEWSVVPPIVTLSLAYGLVLRYHHPTFERMILIMGIFGVLFVGVCWVYCKKADARFTNSASTPQ